MNYVFTVFISIIGISFGMNAINSISGRYGHINKKFNIILAGQISILSFAAAILSAISEIRTAFSMVSLMIGIYSFLALFGSLTGKFSSITFGADIGSGPHKGVILIFSVLCIVGFIVTYILLN
tara:strand:- start:303 stop:674 length:372 start_codon:yes stop_codon:yes gene_type:complete